MQRLAVLVIAIAGASSVARAEVEVGGIGGAHVFSDSGKLGMVGGTMTTGQKNSALFGLRLGVFFTPQLGVEAEGGLIPTEPDTLVFDVYDLALRAQLVYQFHPSADGTLIPFVDAGAGILDVVKTNNQDIIKKGLVFAPQIGFGAKYRANNNWGVRADVRLLLPPKFGSGITTDAEILFGLYKEFGRPKIERKLPTPKKEEDPDHDGIVGAADKCPNEPEDKDGFQDEDGCPDPDNDGDGIPDAKDKCPNEAEDKDGFQDEDGCPDPDNDGDGIPDAADKCPNEPETKNGYQDEDGCPDEIPEKLKQFTGVIQGINFKTNAADLAPGSNGILDKAVAVLTEFKDIKLEIQGHTDDQPIGKGAKFADNAALSQARAETVKAYMVKKGIDESRLIAKGYGDTTPVEDPKDLKGGKLAAARAKNRRVEFKLVMAESPATPAPATPAPAAAPAPAPAAPAAPAAAPEKKPAT